MSQFVLHLAAALLPLLAVTSAAAPDQVETTQIDTINIDTNHTNTNQSLCQQISLALPHRVSRPGSSNYTSMLSEYYTEDERDRYLHDAGVRNGNSKAPQFAFRSGGHSFFAGAANINGGVTVDLRSLDSFKLSADQKTASLGGGSRWSHNVYPNLEPYNLAVAGGRLQGVGVGEFVTGGGLNFLGRRDGFACDNIYGYEVVLASGKVVYASATSNRDLWLALKGGSNNFGIITRFDLKTFPLHDMREGYLQFNVTPTVLEDHAVAWANFMKLEKFDELALWEGNLAWTAGSWTILDFLNYAAPDPAPAAYAEVMAMPGQVANTLVVTNVTTIVEEYSQTDSSHVNRAVQMNYSFKAGDASIFSQIIQSFTDAVEPLKKINGLVWTMLIKPFPVTNGTNSFGLEPNVKDRVLVNIAGAFNDVEDHDTVLTTLEALFKKHVQIVTDAGLFVSYTYLNYAGLNQEPIKSYGNMATLQAVSKKYDPRGIFQKAVPGPWKLF
ncbi:hypothetical protein SLS53_006122 [Cytospora paraplurivora]|uniref:FAD-binding PCMH-type domain-containing protein n=1 Tax=Cytospora paraplurivora TaxID=2898453 RepID=A0AAN9YFC6_9PEZI